MTTPLLRPQAGVEIGPVVVTPAYDIEHPAETVYFNAGTSSAGWTTTFVANGSGATSASVVLASGGSAPNRLALLTNGGTTSVNPLPSARATRAISGLVAGRTYTFTAVTAVTHSAQRTRITLGTGVSDWNATTSEVTVVGSFIATGASATLALEVEDNPASTGASNGVFGYFDSIAVVQDAWTEHVPEVTEFLSLEASSGEVTLDAAVAPYGTATVEIPLIDEALIEQVDPRDDQRVTITASVNATDERTFDLGLRAREVDHKGRKIRLELATDEALLIDYAPLVEDTGARAHEGSLRAICDYALDRIGASLSAGTADADMTARWSAQNSVLNPDGLSTGAPYITAGNSTVTYDTTTNGGQGGVTGYVIGTSAAAGQAFIQIPQSVTTRKGDMWTLSAYMHKANGLAGTQNGILRVYEMDGAGTVLRQIESTPKPLIQSGVTAPRAWDRHSLTFTVQNPNTTKLAVYASMIATAGGQGFGLDSVMLTEGPAVLDYFSGARVPAGYVTAWSGQTGPAPNNSVSTRTPADGVERSPDLFVWKPGVTAWEFLAPFTSQAGLRLFCDETRTWRLIDPADYSVPGRVSIAGWNATEGTDRISREDANVYCTGVVVRYRWRDTDGIEREEIDSAGSPGKVLVWEYERPYPGPGAAAAILARRAGQGRTQDVTALCDYTVTPGIEVSISLPGTVDQIGQTSGVTWTLTDGLMRLGSRGLTDAVPGSWLAWDPAEAWEDVDPLLTWEDA